MKASTRWLAVPVAIAAGLWLTNRGTASATPQRTISGNWKDPDAPRRIRALARPLELEANWPGLGDFLAAVAYTESRGNMKATGDSGTSHGGFQLKRMSAKLDQRGLPTSVLYDERYQVALIADYLHRLRPFASKGQKIDWLALRRGMLYPSRVSDTSEVHARSRSTRKKLSEALVRAGVPASFMYRKAFPPGYQWPGIDRALQLTGAR